MNRAEPYISPRASTLCFSGHRTCVLAEDDAARLDEAVRAAWEAGYRTFISGMAAGFDLAAAEAVVRLGDDVGSGSKAGKGACDGMHGGVRLVAAVPYAGQPRDYPPRDLARYQRLLAVADEVRTLAASYSHGCYFRRDDWMVDRSARIVCWYDPSQGASGTRYTVRRAVAVGLEVVNLFRDPAGSLF